MYLSESIIVRESLLEITEYISQFSFNESKKENFSKAFVSIDITIPDRFQQMLFSSLSNRFPTLVVNKVIGGEELKSWAFLQKLISTAIYEGVDSSWALFGIGGGSLLDAVGFFASIYHRGSLPYCSIPTTLLAMTDAAIGGKNGINIEGVKNVIGTLFNPKKVLISAEFVQGFSLDELVSGSIEMWKHAILTSLKAEVEFQSVVRALPNSFEFASILLFPEIKNSVERKLQFVDNPSFSRDFLNIGHTIGHAIEAAFEQKIPHGIAVLYGIYIEMLIAVERGVQINKQLLSRSFDFIQWVEMYVDLSYLQNLFDRSKYIHAIARDKKNSGTKKAHILILEDFGLPYGGWKEGLFLQLCDEEVEWSMEWLQKNCSWM